MTRRCGVAAFTLACGIVSGTALALTVGVADTFQDGTTAGWTSGVNNPTPPVNVSTGGPLGAGDRYLLVTSSGAAGSGGRLVAISGPQWGGDYILAGVTSIGMDVNNLGPNALSLRLLFEAPGASALSSDAILVPVGSGWTHIAFPISPGALTGSAIASLSGATGIRLFHNTSAVSPGPPIAAQLGVDNIIAIAASGPNASLSDLSLSAGSLVPAFASGTLAYTVSVSNATSTLTVTPTAADANATIKVNTIAVASGSASGAIALAVGSGNVITVEVTAQGGAPIKTYTITVTRATHTAPVLAPIFQLLLD